MVSGNTKGGIGKTQGVWTICGKTIQGLCEYHLGCRGDFTPPLPYRWVVDALAEGIREGGGKQLMTAHCGQESPANVFGDRKWLDFSNVYNYADDLYNVTLKEYQRTPVKPFVMLESVYEGEHASNPIGIRRKPTGPCSPVPQGISMATTSVELRFSGEGLSHQCWMGKSPRQSGRHGHESILEVVSDPEME